MNRSTKITTMVTVAAVLVATGISAAVFIADKHRHKTAEFGVILKEETIALQVHNLYEKTKLFTDTYVKSLNKNTQDNLFKFNSIVSRFLKTADQSAHWSVDTDQSAHWSVDTDALTLDIKGENGSIMGLDVTNFVNIINTLQKDLKIHYTPQSFYSDSKEFHEAAQKVLGDDEPQVNPTIFRNLLYQRTRTDENNKVGFLNNFYKPFVICRWRTADVSGLSKEWLLQQIKSEFHTEEFNNGLPKAEKTEAGWDRKTMSDYVNYRYHSLESESLYNNKVAINLLKKIFCFLKEHEKDRNIIDLKKHLFGIFASNEEKCPNELVGIIMQWSELLDVYEKSPSENMDSVHSKIVTTYRLSLSELLACNLPNSNDDLTGQEYRNAYRYQNSSGLGIEVEGNDNSADIYKTRAASETYRKRIEALARYANLNELCSHALVQMQGLGDHIKDSLVKEAETIPVSYETFVKLADNPSLVKGNKDIQVKASYKGVFDTSFDERFRNFLKNVKIEKDDSDTLKSKEELEKWVSKKLSLTLSDVAIYAIYLSTNDNIAPPEVKKWGGVITGGDEHDNQDVYIARTLYPLWCVQNKIIEVF